VAQFSPLSFLKPLTSAHMLKDYYDILSVPQDASLAEIKQQYQKLLLIVMRFNSSSDPYFCF
jgi:preprotein translocase subunit Sec63